MNEKQAERIVVAIEAQSAAMVKLCDLLAVLPAIGHANTVMLQALSEQDEVGDTVDPRRTLEDEAPIDLADQYDLAKPD